MLEVARFGDRLASDDGDSLERRITVLVHYLCIECVMERRIAHSLVVLLNPHLSAIQKCEGPR